MCKVHLCFWGNAERLKRFNSCIGWIEDEYNWQNHTLHVIALVMISFVIQTVGSGLLLFWSALPLPVLCFTVVYQTQYVQLEQKNTSFYSCYNLKAKEGKTPILELKHFMLCLHYGCQRRTDAGDGRCATAPYWLTGLPHCRAPLTLGVDNPLGYLQSMSDRTTNVGRRVLHRAVRGKAEQVRIRGEK